MSFQNKIKELRIEHGETQNDLATFLNISVQSISKWENGIGYPSVDTIIEISNKYNCSIDYLLKDQEEEKEHIRQYVLRANHNKVSPFSVFTDSPSICNAENVPGRHRTPASLKQCASDKDNDYIIVVDSNGKIIYLCKGTGYGYGSPDDEFYHRKNLTSPYDLDCFYIMDTYEPYRYNRGLNYNDFEFLIPKGGFIITVYEKTFYFRKLRAIFDLDNSYGIAGSLDRFTIKFEDGFVIIYDDQSVIKKDNINGELSIIFEKYLDDNRFLEENNERIQELEARITYLESTLKNK